MDPSASLTLRSGRQIGGVIKELRWAPSVCFADTLPGGRTRMASIRIHLIKLSVDYSRVLINLNLLWYSMFHDERDSL